MKHPRTLPVPTPAAHNRGCSGNVLDWEGLIKRYVWDHRTTPYLVPLAKLNRRQADYEILAYCLFLGVLFAVVAVTALSGATSHGRSPGMALYGFSVVCAAMVFGFGKSYAAALYLGTTPLAGLAYLLLYGFRSDRHLLDTLVVTVLVLLLLWYTLRITTVARIYPTLPEPGDDDSPRRRLFKR